MDSAQVRVRVQVQDMEMVVDSAQVQDTAQVRVRVRVQDMAQVRVRVRVQDTAQVLVRMGSCFAKSTDRFGSAQHNARRPSVGFHKAQTKYLSAAQ
jgi:hypothetical protein